MQKSQIKYNFKVLYVEDDELISKATLRFLKRIVKDVLVAHDGLDGLNIFKNENIDLVITDIMMPKMNGLDMLEKIKEINNSIPVIVTTAFDDQEYFLKSIDLNVDKYIIKPTSVKKLDEAIGYIYEQFKLKKENREQQVLLDEYKYAIDTSLIVSKANPKGIITYVNDKFCEISGYDREELIGKPHNIVRHKDMSSDIFKILWETIKSKQIWRGRVTNQKRDGGEYIVETIILPLLDKNKNIKEFISLRQDVTDFVKMGRKLQEEQNKQKEQEKRHFQELNQTKDSFLVVFTHELKTPLNAIINFASFAIRRVAKVDFKAREQVVDMLEVVKENGHDMLDVVNNILDISKLKANKMNFLLSNFDIKDAVDDILKKYSSLVEKESIDLTCDFFHDNVKIKSDKNRVKQLLSNLISNAIKYGNGKINISTKLDKNGLIFTIEDNGNGIKNKTGIFDLFEQEESDDMTRTAKGTGVGLHFVKLLCDGLSIDMVLDDSQKLGGARFTLLFLIEE